MRAKKEIRDEKIIVLVTTKQKRALEEEAVKQEVSLAQVVRDKLFPKPVV